MVVLGIVLASMASLLSAIYNTGTQTVEAGTLQDEARSAVDTLVSDLRQAYTGDSATPFVASMSSTAITFYLPGPAAAVSPAQDRLPAVREHVAARVRHEY